MVKNIFRGMGVALITPFKADFSVDYESLDRLLDYLISEGADFCASLQQQAKRLVSLPKRSQKLRT